MSAWWSAHRRGHCLPDWTWDVLVVQRILVQSPGGMNGVAGRFEWIVDGNSLTHQRFVPEGSINGIPNTP